MGKGKNPISYRDAGVDISKADEWIEQIKHLARKTYTTRVLSGVGGFAGLFRLDYDETLFKINYKKPLLVACADGVGTKILIAKQANRFDTIGIDLVAMNLNDMITLGAEPLFFLDYLAVGKLTPEREIELIKGISHACEESNCTLLGGETAEMPGLYSQGEFDISGFAVGVVELDRIIDGTRIESGDIILGLASNGLHSNGFSLVRKIIFEKLNLDINDKLPGFNCTVADELLKPTRLYVRPILRLLSRYKVKKVVRGIAHITGGGIVNNIPRILPDGCKAIIHTDTWEVPKIFKFIQSKGPVKRSEMFRVFNMGIGMILIVRSAFVNSIKSFLEKMGQRVYQIGRITRGKKEVELR